MRNQFLIQVSFEFQSQEIDRISLSIIQQNRSSQEHSQFNKDDKK